ncbi:GDSL esterase/lipase At5g42170-like [Vigna umbellata]|uniref:GDSL esterase/lipase At5g42170-like n=1 Tax=Vigna umbellata TaxID=87088 RepID=UPI001F5EE79E|nr:GDSL esterase/lipase At5g42170-like [Vigna umbellata]
MFFFEVPFSKLFLVVLWSFSTVIISLVNVVSLPNNYSVPAVFVFGDSIVDTGNNNYIKTIAKCNFRPYGKDFGGGNQPTGRFSNGLVPSDIIAAKFEVKKLLPPYLDPNLKREDLLTGVSFASGANGYDPLTSKIALVLSLSDQLDKFKEYIKKIQGMVGENTTTSLISKSLYILCTGSNDITHTFFLRRLKYNISTYTDFMASQATMFLKELHGLGARRIGILGLPNVGCVPFERTIRGGFKRACSDADNQAAMLFNNKLSSQIDILGKNFPDARLVYLDVYNPLSDMIQNPSKYGFEVADKGCCGTGDFEVGFLCNPVLKICSNRSSYIFWDSFHPTERAFNILSSEVLDKNINKFF